MIENKLIEKIKCDETLKTLKKIISECDEIYLVGGAIRDYLFDQIPKEYDFISKTPFKTSKIIAEKLGLKSFKTGKDLDVVYRIFFNEGGIDFSPIGYKKLEQNLRKRDFTIDSIAINIDDFSLYDPLCGIKDAQKKVLKMGYNNSFKDDPLRILKGYRLECSYPELKWDKETRNEAIRLCNTIKSVPKERIKEELKKILTQKSCVNILKEMAKDGILFEIFPCLKELKGLRQPKPHKRDVLGHTFDILQILEENFEFFENTSFFRHNLDDILKLRLAILFHDSGKGKCFFKDSKGIHFYGHSKESAKLAEEVLSSLTFSRSFVKEVSNLCDLHLRPILLFKEKQPSISSKRRLVKDAGDNFPMLVLMSYLDFISMKRCEEEIIEFNSFCNELFELFKNDGEEIIKPEKIVDGFEAMEILGIEKGKELGKALSSLKKAQIDGSVKTKKDVVKFLIKYRKLNLENK
jgi:poly(A) polymerase